MTKAVSVFRMSRILCTSALALAVVACTEKEPVLQGVREPIRPELAGKVENQSRAISLAKQTVNKDWAQPHGTAAYRVANAALSVAPNLIWSTNIGSGDERRQRITAQPAVGAGRIYTLDSAGQVSAVSPDGSILWQSDIIPATDSEGQATGGGIAYHKGAVYISSGFGVLTALDAASGDLIWRQELDAPGSGQPLVRDGLVYVVAGDDTGWAVKTKDGRIAWQIEATPSAANVLGAPAPALTKDLAVFAFGSGDLAATFRKGGFRRWNASIAGERTGRTVSTINDVTGAPVVVGQRIYVGNHGGRTAAFEADSGLRLWTAREGALGPVWPAGDSLFQVSDTNRLLRLDADTGEVIWSQPLPGFVKDKPRKRSEIVAHYGPILAGGQIIVASNDGLLRFFDPTDGILNRSVEVPGGATTPPVVAGKTLYVVSTKGELLAFR
ncbi:PQQ-binding-like beta-propeller repeat protein [Epibacterium sp. SM1969]|uniref:PQQ-binding-like beta-propeller repeat protein n=1 Tax=Tritonibacter aquimaris TaxID=2663379 RepID=A0A844AXI1_9RHOB|nr:PQQ-like beta-propeller repeat protein [Tritonibacter aquimaris]MQY44288.1 PQQ-binding-like beta-propeller repeat protein [Tritonibacter aquimaris]